jgi:Tfp pilus assembly protein PilN
MVMQSFNLASTDYRRSRRRTRFLAGSAVLLLLLLAGQLALWADTRRETQATSARLASVDTEIRRLQEEGRAARAAIPAEALKQYEARVAAYNQILEASAFSWIGLLVELERSVPPGVVLGEIQPDLPTGRVSLRGTARTFEALTLLLRGLEERTLFRDVYLLHQSVKKPTEGRPESLEFLVNLIYKGRR